MYLKIFKKCYFTGTFTPDAVKLRSREFAFSEILCMFASEINNDHYLGYSEILNQKFQLPLKVSKFGKE